MEKTETKINGQSESLTQGMFEVGAHYGYSKSRRHPSFSSLIFGTKEGNDIINLEKTNQNLTTALSFITESVSSGKTILFVGTKPEVRKIVENAVLSINAPYVVHRWIGGLITNFSEIKKRVKKLEELLVKKEKGELDVYTKVERMGIDEEIESLLLNFGGIVSMKKTPDVMFIVDPRHEETALMEAKRKKIPVVALLNSDCDLTQIDYPIPANDSNVESVAFFMEKVKEAYQTGLKTKKVVEVAKA